MRVDFYCATCRLIVKIDGDLHADQIAYDNARTQWLNEDGYHVIRFSNWDVFRRVEAVLEATLMECKRLPRRSRSADSR